MLLTPHAVRRPAPGGLAQGNAAGLTRRSPAARRSLPVIGHATSERRALAAGHAAGPPERLAGWITQRGTTHVDALAPVVKTSTRQVRVYHRGRLRRSFSAVIGKPSTPTPHGRFFVEESIAMPPGSAGAPFALATSARSNVLQEFAGGPGQIALHGVANLGGMPGTAVSHGCVRLAKRTSAGWRRASRPARW